MKNEYIDNKIKCLEQKINRTAQFHLDAVNEKFAELDKKISDFVKHTTTTKYNNDYKKLWEENTKDYNDLSQHRLNDYTKGGLVESTMKFLPTTIYDYKGVRLSGSHCVKEEGQFIEVENSKYGILTDRIEPVYTLVTSEHRIFINGIEFGDYLNGTNEDWEPYYKLLKNKINKEIAEIRI